MNQSLHTQPSARISTVTLPAAPVAQSGQSGCLLSSGSQVRVLPGALLRREGRCSFEAITAPPVDSRTRAAAGLSAARAAPAGGFPTSRASDDEEAPPTRRSLSWREVSGPGALP